MPSAYGRSPLDNYLEDAYRDPFEEYLRKADSSAQPHQGPAFPVLSEQAEESMLGSVFRKGMSGLGYLGETLDKPGRAVRGLLAGRPEELLNLLPFSDTFEWTKPEQAISGRDLLETAGLLGKNEEGIDWGDAAGFAAAVATDPLTYLTFGTSALTQGGKAAAKAGTLARTAAERIAKKEGGLIGFMGTPLGTGPMAETIARHAGNALDKVKYGSWSPVRVARGLLDYRAGNTSVAAVQKGHEFSFLPELEKLSAGAREDALNILRRAKEAGIADDVALERLVVEAGENVANRVALTPQQQLAVGFGDEMATRFERELGELNSLGYRTREFTATDPLGRTLRFFHRQQDPLDPAKGGGVLKRLFTGHMPADMQREEILRNLPRETINAMAKDKNLRAILDAAPPGTASPQARDLILNQYLGNPTTAHVAHKELFKQAEHLADFVRTLDPRHAEGAGIDLFRRSPFVDFGEYLVGSAGKKAGAKALHQTLKDNARPLVSGDMALSEVLRKAGLDFDETVNGVRTGGKTYLANLLGKSIDDLDRHGVSPDIAEALIRSTQGHSAPEAWKPLLNLTDSLSNWWRSNVTMPFPAFHLRNLFGGSYANWLTRAHDPAVGGAWNPLAYLSPYKDAHRISKGEEIAGIANRLFPGQNLTDARATAMLADEMFIHRAAGRQRGLGQVRGNLTGLPDEQLSTILPGTAAAVNKPSLARLKEFDEWSDLAPWKQEGVFGASKTTNPLLREGAYANEQVEFLNRASHYLSRRYQGYDPSVAGRLTREAQFDYSALSEAEKAVARRLFGFYTFSRKNLPFHLNQLLTDPARLAGVVRGGNVAGAQSNFIPEYLQGGVAVPVGEKRGDTQTFLSQLGLTTEEATGRFHPGSVLRTVEEHAGMLNPLLKTPLELLTGRQMFSGRELGELYGPTESLGLPKNTTVDQLIMNSPASRAYTSGRTLADILGLTKPERAASPAKVMNLLTGVKLTDVDVEKQKEIQGKKLLEQILESEPAVKEFRKFYVPEQARALLSEPEINLMRLEETLLARAKIAALKRAAAAGDLDAARELQKKQARFAERK